MKNLKQLALAICLSFAVILANSQFVEAQQNKQTEVTGDESPSLQETFNWLKSKLEGSEAKYTNSISAVFESPLLGKQTEKVEFKWKHIYSDFSLDGCSMKWTQKISVDTSNGTVAYQVQLSELDPLNIKVSQVEPDTSYFNSPQKTGTVSPDTWKIIVQQGDEKAKKLLVELYFNDREMAKRAAKAFQNAIKKCGGKVEPF